MIFHAFVIELDQLVYGYPRKRRKKMYVHSVESCSFVVLVSHILAKLPSSEGAIGIPTNLCKIITL